ncbi:MAG: magnesium-translocating P-type ATPase [Burkholderiales bacterium]
MASPAFPPRHPDTPTVAAADLARLEPAGALVRLDASPTGLTNAQALERLQREGENVVARRSRRSPLLRLAAMFATPLPLLLIVLAVVADLTGEAGGAIVIAIMVVLSTLLSFVQEHRADRAAEKLRAMVHTTATVRRRSGTEPPEAPTPECEIPIHELVPGDIVQLRAGDMIPADLRLLASKDLFVNQAALTGESLPAEKHATAPDAPVDSPLEEATLCFMGSNVISGTATAVVAATGGRTYFASIAEGLDRAQPQTSFDQGVNRFIGLLLRFMVVMVPLVFFVNGLTKGHWTEAFLFAVAVAVGLTPEMLPMLVTINLGKGALAMSRKQVIVKRLASIQNFGAMDILCTDKTGTLTQDRVLLKRHIDIFGQESARVLDYAYLNSHYQSGLRNLLDVAILEHGDVHEALGVGRRFTKVDEIPFDFQRRRMSVVVSKESDTHVLVCKGAVEEIFSVCAHAERGGDLVDLVPGHLEDLQAVVRDLNEDGFRVIAVATKSMPARPGPYTVEDETGLTLAGYIAFLDPPKDSAADAIRHLHRHGVSVKVLTGDNDVVTRKVCRDVGLSTAHCLLGRDIEAMDDAQLAKAARTATVFAKLAPLQKARIIEALRRSGHVVGFLGDGINDSPALKAADVGVSVDTAVDIAKESADIVLLEKNLLVLDEGVIEGRKVFGNIVKYLKMGASSNFGNMLSVLGASAFLPFLPMAPVQILLNNLLYDISQTAVATDQVDREYTRSPRRWDIGHIGRFMLLIGPISSIFDYVTYFTLLHVFGAWTDPALFQTGWFVESLLSQTLVVHVIRTGRIPFLQSRASGALLVTTVAICLLGMWLPYSPFAELLGFKPLPVRYWLALLVILAGYLVLTQTVKAWLVRRFGLG